MNSKSILSSFRTCPQVPGILTVGVLALSQTLVVPAFAQVPVTRTATTDESPTTWRANNAQKLRELKLQSYQLPPTRARNVIVFLGDGMGISTITAARILEGQNVKGLVNGEENLLSFEKFPYAALSRTYSMNQQVPDSAPTMTAIMTGVKTNGDCIGTDKTVGIDEAQKVNSSTKLRTLMEQAKAAGLGAGVVSTARVTHATPAACYSHVPNRDYEFAGYTNGTTFNQSTYDAAGVKDIAAQLIEQPYGSLDVVLGGGRTYFMKNTVVDPEYGMTVTGSATSGASVISVSAKKAWVNGTLSTSTSAISVGSVVSGTGIADGTKVTAVDPTTGALTIDKVTTAAIAGDFLVGTSKGKRTDGRDLISEWKAKASPATSAYVWNKASFDALPPTTTRLMGLFEPSHVQYETDRVASTVVDPITKTSTTVPGDKAGEPSLTDMTSKAIDVLSKNRRGYVLMVEGGRIDHGHHAGNAYRALTDAIEFSNAVQKAVEKVGPDTLIVVTADHSHVFTIAGYPDRGNPILGLMKSGGVTQTDMLGLPYTTLGYQNGAGYTGAALKADNSIDQAAGVKVEGYGAPFFPAKFSAATGRPDLTNIDTTAKGYMQEVAIPLNNETHAGEDVGIFAKGPNSHLFRGSLDQSMIYWIMADALRLNN